MDIGREKEVWRVKPQVIPKELETAEPVPQRERKETKEPVKVPVEK